MSEPGVTHRLSGCPEASLSATKPHIIIHLNWALAVAHNHLAVISHSRILNLLTSLKPLTSLPFSHSQQVTVPPNYRENRSHRTIFLALLSPNVQTYLHHFSWLTSHLLQCDIFKDRKKAQL